MAQRKNKKTENSELTYLVLENDHALFSYFQKYIDHNGLDPEIVYGADQRDTDEIAAKFAEHDVLLINPNLVSFSQYNLMMMLMYDCITKNSLRIKEIRIFSNVDRSEELRDMWAGKRKYLDIVLKSVKIYQVDASDYTKTQVEL